MHLFKSGSSYSATKNRVNSALLFLMSILSFSLVSLLGAEIKGDSKKSENQSPASTLLNDLPDLGWADDLKKEFDVTKEKYPNDLIGTYFRLKQIIKEHPPLPPQTHAAPKKAVSKPTKQRELARLTTEQQTWIETKLDSMRPKAISALQRDYDAALKESDYRAAIIASYAADKVQTNSLQRAPALSAALKSKVMAGEKLPSPVWEIKNAKGSYLQGEFSENSLGNSIRFSANDGFELLRITAEAKNISAKSDPKYVVWCLNVIDFFNYYIREEMSIFVDQVAEPNRLADDDFIFLFTPGGDMIPVNYVCKDGLPAVATGTASDPQGKIIKVYFTGKFVTQGGEFKMDVIFQVPKGIKDFKLLMLGAAAIPVIIEK